MHLLSPGPAVDDRALEELYAYPAELTSPFVQVNFVASADGAATVSGRSRGLSSPADKKVFALGRDLADVVLVGAGTALAEGYRGVKHTELRASRRSNLGLTDVPPIAVVTGRGSVDPTSQLITDTTVPPIVLTSEAAPTDWRKAMADAGVDVVVAGEDRVDPALALHALADRGLLRVCCEGGPTLFADLIAANLVDQLCLTVAPLLTGAGAVRVADGLPASEPMSLTLESVLSDEGFLMLRYRKKAASGPE
ncbi:pyrimidine reductase family protein [Actinophytocola algeriensis]|uniref:5-amino-6-(5-phosphoribosylamino)uracil reductase n=1 Tax=Actinophytocola algeriensis TaxID=1768010 RepID=A0A7W7VH58_9PSEU|nr:pyrimidine reductase family protein [Actinophytocola algeriensis]MBB4910066.1 5-amino-6-(5-phosphoribosylamino)uracil reductase [Actinophytocola algeriensis]MBE1476056.1 5-amino-6-(5-phosphoribosylamino)uracil reductase [Actinophytocola algeriensis]